MRGGIIMIKHSIRVVVLLAVFVCSLYAITDSTGINHLKQHVVTKIDDEVKNGNYGYSFVKVGLVYDGEVVFTKAYGNNNQVNEVHIWASISKPITTMVAMQLVEDGLIQSIDDNIWEYCDKYIDCMPAQYVNSDLTIKHIMTHTSGIPHYDKPTWVGDKLNIQFEPGSRRSYSTHAWGVLGDVLTAITGKDFNTLIKEYTGEPVGATTLWAVNQDEIWRSPGGFVHSSVQDLVTFSIGVMNNVYVTEQTLYNDIAKVHVSSSQGLGWNVSNAGSDNIIISHSGAASDGSNTETYLRVKPRKKISAGAMGLRSGGNSFGTLCRKLMDILEDDPDPTPIVQLASKHNTGSLNIAVDTRGNVPLFTVSKVNTGTATLVIYDLSGRTVWKHNMNRVFAGKQTVQWYNSRSYAGKMFIVSVLENGNAKKSKRFVLMK
jgi:CubicO group peptidase (beta-lactamase class C family)